MLLYYDLCGWSFFKKWNSWKICTNGIKGSLFWSAENAYSSQILWSPVQYVQRCVAGQQGMLTLPRYPIPPPVCPKVCDRSTPVNRGCLLFPYTRSHPRYIQGLGSFDRRCFLLLVTLSYYWYMLEGCLSRSCASLDWKINISIDICYSLSTYL
jgi:hypothetical protein